jgi:small subunit ribosomal protein S6
MFLLDTNKVAGDVTEAAKQLHGMLEKNGCEILASRPWDERKLAYPIHKSHSSHKKGLYYLTYFRTESKNIVAIEKDCSLNEMILRLLVLRIHPKWIDPLLAVARDEHQVHLQTVNEPLGDEEGGEGGEEERPRRGGRRMAEMKD